MNPLVRQVIGEAATPDEFSAKDYLLSLPQEYSGYTIHVSADPMFWGGCRREVAERAAHRLAEMAKEQFPGIETRISLEPNTYPSRGIDADVMERMDSWITDNATDALLAQNGV